MTLFWLVVAGLIVLALALILPALLRKAKTTSQLNRKELNILIAKEKIADLDEEFDRGALENEDYEEAKNELELGLIDDVNQNEDHPTLSAKPAWLTSFIILLFVPVASLFLYQYLGNPSAVNVLQVSENSATDRDENLSALLSQLYAKLEKDPTDTEGWMILGRTHMSQRKYSEAEEAFSRLLKLQPENPEYMLLKADAMAMNRNGSIIGQPEELINAALEKDPDNLTGLWLAGMAAREKNNNELALQHWNKLKTLLPANSADLESVNQMIAEASGEPVQRDSRLPPDIATMVEKLQQKLKAEPDSPEGWAMLGRSLLLMSRYEEAANALSEANKQNANDPEIMLALADALAMANQGNMQGRAGELIERALEINPNSIKALWLSGMKAQQNNNDTQAIIHWQKLIPLLTNDPQSRSEVATLIKNAGGKIPETQEFSKSDISEAKTGQSVTLSISLADKLIGEVSPEDSVFIYAKAFSGPPMPLAAARMQVKDFPIIIKLDDGMAMTPQTKLSSFDEILVGARVSKSGQATATSGDLFTEKGPVALGSSVDLLIENVIP